MVVDEDRRWIFRRKKRFISVSKEMRREKYGLSRLVLIRREERSTYTIYLA